MKIHFKITPDMDKLTRNLEGNVDGARRAGMTNVVTTIEATARKDAPVKRSNLANSGTSKIEDDGSKGTITFTAPYAGHVHEGTGLYGPHRTKIVPKSKKALFWRGAAHPVKSVRGMVGKPFLKNAAEKANIPSLFAEGANNYLTQHGGQ
ncbi:MAG: hypothetical protein WC405_18440 [Syntrophales bacterium]